MNVVTCFVLTYQAGACQELASSQVESGVPPMSLYLSLVISCVAVWVATDMAHLWRMPKQTSEPTELATMSPYRVLAHFLVYHASLIGVFAIVGILVPQIPYWMTVLFDLPVSPILEGSMRPNTLYSATEVFVYVQTLIVLLVAMSVTRRVRKRISDSPFMPIEIETDTIHIYRQT